MRVLGCVFLRVCADAWNDIPRWCLFLRLPSEAWGGGEMSDPKLKHYLSIDAALAAQESRFSINPKCRIIYAAGVDFMAERDMNPVMKMAVPTTEKARVNGSWGGRKRRAKAAIKRELKPIKEKKACAVKPKSEPRFKRFQRVGDKSCKHLRAPVPVGMMRGKPRQKCPECGAGSYVREEDRIAAAKYLTEKGTLPKRNKKARQ